MHVKISLGFKVVTGYSGTTRGAWTNERSVPLFELKVRSTRVAVALGENTSVHNVEGLGCSWADPCRFQDVIKPLDDSLQERQELRNLRPNQDQAMYWSPFGTVCG